MQMVLLGLVQYGYLASHGDPMSPIHSRKTLQALIFLGWAGLFHGACATEAELVDIDCGEDRVLVMRDTSYCIYCSPDIPCPPGVPRHIELHGGLVCASQGVSAAEVPLGIAEELDQRCASPADAGAD